MQITDLLKKLTGHPKWGLLLQFIKFGIVGASNTLISLGVYYLCFYGLRFHYQISNLLAFLISVTNAYFWNSRVVFKVKGNKASRWKAYFRTVLAYGSTYLLSAGLLWLWTEAVGISPGIAPLINLLITIPLNFVLIKKWALSGRNSESDGG
jgi:putative flippase GtrA